MLLPGGLAVDVAFLDVDRVARAGDDPLDEVHARLHRFRLRAGGSAELDDVRCRPADLFLGFLGGVEHRDLTDVRFAEVRADPVDQHALADRERRFHRAAGDAVGLDDERLDAERETECHRDDHDQLHDRVPRDAGDLAHAYTDPDRPVTPPTGFTPVSRRRSRLLARPHRRRRGHRQLTRASPGARPRRRPRRARSPLDLLSLARGILRLWHLCLLGARVRLGRLVHGVLRDSALSRRGALEHRLLRGHAIRVGRAVRLDRLRIDQQTGLTACSGPV